MFPLFGASESNSSKNIIDGDSNLAFRKISLMFFSLSPIYIFSNSGPLILRNANLHSFAMHLTSNVFPVPGGPKSKIPFLGFILPVNNYGRISGIIIVFITSYFTDLRPPISCQDISYIFCFLS